MTPMRLTDSLAEKAAGFPETSNGVTIVSLILADGRRIQNVTLAWGSEIIRVGGQQVDTPSQLGFEIAMIRDVLPH